MKGKILYMDGIILIDKEKDISSFGVVARIRKIFNTKKVGHCGTLDPQATGVLPIMIGQATKISKYLVEHDKEYIAVVKLGIQTDSADSEGNVIKSDNFLLDKEKETEYINKITKLVGKQKQIPPMYSAIKINGKKLYEYAREGIELERQARNIEIYDINVEKFDYLKNEITFRVKCSKGTYVRTLCENISEVIGTVGFMKELRRIKVDKFDVNDSIKLVDLENMANKEEKIISIEKLFEKYGSIILDVKSTKLFLNGVQLSRDLNDGIYRIYNEGSFLGIGIINKGRLKRDVII